jgi:cyclophilin family peptidyl-prolyl cis-trans isomerase
MPIRTRTLAILCGSMLAVSTLAQAPPKQATPAPLPKFPVITIETVKGTIVVETFPLDAPKSVEHIVALVKRRFYDGTAIHRIVPGQLAQWGDQQSRNAQLKEWWGRGPGSGSGSPIGVAEISKRRHRLGTVSLAHPGSPASADSQLFFALRAAPQWDGKYTIIGQVTTGLDILPRLQVGDRIKKVTVTS